MRLVFMMAKIGITRCLIALVLCSSITATPGVAAEPRKVAIAYSSIGPMAAGIWMAKESGAFEKYGLAADILLITSGPVSVQSLIGGDLQVVSGASNAVINAILSGAPIIAVGGTANRRDSLWLDHR
jgi:ABC-type nitrate/sulfonate/bicarbonate transport system substrate-binding protein